MPIPRFSDWKQSIGEDWMYHLKPAMAWKWLMHDNLTTEDRNFLRSYMDKDDKGENVEQQLAETLLTAANQLAEALQKDMQLLNHLQAGLKLLARKESTIELEP